MISKRQGIIATIFGTAISTINSIVQFLTIYFILNKFGTAFNGFVRVSSTFSFLVAASDSAIGISTTLLLVKPLNESDWITANEIYSTSRRNYKRNAFVGLIMAVLLSVSYSAFVCLQANGESITNINWEHFSLKPITYPNGGESSILVLIAISMIYSLRYFFMALFFNSYENILSASNKNGIIKLCALISDLTCFGIMLAILNSDSPNPIFFFLPIFFSSLIRGLLITIYIKRQFKWIKFYKDFNSFRVEANAKKISWSTIGQQIILNTDVVILSIIFGLNVSSTLSLYLVVAVNTRIVMKNFIISFREYFIMLIAKRGRIKWESFCKYELYSIIVAVFTFANLSILSPYFVTALYGKQALVDGINDEQKNAILFILTGPTFSLIYALSSFIDIMIESQYLLINAKGRSQEITKFQIALAIVYLVFIAVTCPVLIKTRGLIIAIKFMFIFKTCILALIYFYLYRYILKYVTYNSCLKFTSNNFLITIVSLISFSFVQQYICGKYMPVAEYALIQGDYVPSLFKLVLLFLISVLVSSVSITLISLICSPYIMISIFSSLPLLGRLTELRKNKERENRITENNVKLLESDELFISGEIVAKNKINNDSVSDKKVYKIKG